MRGRFFTLQNPFRAIYSMIRVVEDVRAKLNHYCVYNGSTIVLITHNRLIAERYAEQLRKRIELAQS